ncbi:MAG: aminomethyltransferase family protein [Planctomycetaceae bacterium]|nr:aminomethyltransferase family protein [Planctomycetaceae bacterium]
MTADGGILHTPLDSLHRELGATMAPFGGWDMPLWYRAGAVKEHLAVVQAAGLFDTSHMDVITVMGGNAAAFLNYAFTRDIAGLQPGRCAYGAFLDEQGHCLDDAIVYPQADGFAVVLNASMGQRICDHLKSLPGAADVNIRPLQPRLAKFDIQGPAAPKLLAPFLADADALFAKFPYFSFKGSFDLSQSDVRLADGTPILLSRTGYTGEMGFELFLPEDKAPGLFRSLLGAGSGDGLVPCGLAARDSLRTGAVLPLSHQDIGPWPFINHPWPFALPLAADGSFTKKFHGADALLAADATATLPFVGSDPRRVEPHDAVVLDGDREIGTVTTIVSDMAIGRVDGRVVSWASAGKPEGWNPRGLACGFIRVDRAYPAGTKLTLKDARRAITVEVADDIRPDRTARKKLEWKTA